MEREGIVAGGGMDTESLSNTIDILSTSELDAGRSPRSTLATAISSGALAPRAQ
jgi:hypothetical protein